MPSFVVSRTVVPRLVELSTASSTNDELLRISSSEAVPDYTTVVTSAQTAGRGRRDRTWSSPPGRGLAISVLLPLPEPDDVGWLPLAAGLAMRDAVAPELRRPVSVKWPNDVLVEGRKVCGVLGQLVRTGVVMGAGINIRLTESELPVPTASSLTLSGAVDDANLEDRVLSGYLTRLRDNVDQLINRGPVRSGLRDAVVAACGTLGQTVRVELPDGEQLEGLAIDISDDARLAIRTPEGDIRKVSAGDVVHVRPSATD